MAKNRNLPPKKPKDPAKPTRAKASRPDDAAMPDALADLLNPGIKRGSAGMGSGTGSNIQPAPDNSFDRRRQFSGEHTARKSTKGFDEAPQSDFTGPPVSGLDPEEIFLANREKFEPIRRAGLDRVKRDLSARQVWPQLIERCLERGFRRATFDLGRVRLAPLEVCAEFNGFEHLLDQLRGDHD